MPRSISCFAPRDHDKNHGSQEGHPLTSLPFEAEDETVWIGHAEGRLDRRIGDNRSTAEMLLSYQNDTYNELDLPEPIPRDDPDQTVYDTKYSTQRYYCKGCYKQDQWEQMNLRPREVDHQGKKKIIDVLEFWTETAKMFAIVDKKHAGVWRFWLEGGGWSQNFCLGRQLSYTLPDAYMGRRVKRPLTYSLTPNAKRMKKENAEGSVQGKSASSLLSSPLSDLPRSADLRPDGKLPVSESPQLNAEGDATNDNNNHGLHSSVELPNLTRPPARQTTLNHESTTAAPSAPAPHSEITGNDLMLSDNTSPIDTLGDSDRLHAKDVAPEVNEQDTSAASSTSPISEPLDILHESSDSTYQSCPTSQPSQPSSFPSSSPPIGDPGIAELSDILAVVFCRWPWARDDVVAESYMKDMLEPAHTNNLDLLHAIQGRLWTYLLMQSRDRGIA